MGRQEEAQRVAEELLADIELQRLKASDVVLKAGRLARLVGHDDLQTFLELERNGYPTDGSVEKWVSRAGRWSDKEKEHLFVVPIGQMEALADGAQAALAALTGGGNYSGDHASVAGRQHDEKINMHSNTLRTSATVCKQVVATVYEMVVEIHHELLFSDLQATLFADTQTNVDGVLAEASGSALSKIERVSDRLRDGDPESISQGLTTCRRLIDSCADHLFPAQEREYDVDDQVKLRVSRAGCDGGSHSTEG